MKKVCIRRIVIEPGCIGCKACQFYAPTIFEVDKKSHVKPDLSAEHICAHEADIEKAAQRCPVKVIKLVHDE